MRIRALLSLSILAVAGAAAANLNQIDPTNQLVSTPTFGVMQIFPDFQNYSGTVVEDFFTLGVVVKASAAFELSDPSIFSTLHDRVTGWRISLWESPQKASQSGNFLDQNALATVFVPSNSGQIVYSRITDSQVAAGAFRVVISGLSLVTPPGLVWIGMAPEMPFANNGQFFILTNLQPVNRGGGAPNNSRGINPGNGFGGGQLWDAPLTDVAYAVESIPEPASLLALAVGLGALALRRRPR